MMVRMLSVICALLCLLPAALQAADVARVYGDLKVNGVTFGDSSTLYSSSGLMKNRGGWYAATLYSAGDVVQSGGVSYVCTFANINAVPPNAAYWAVLAGGLNRGSWSSIALYNIGDIVQSSGSAYISTAVNMNQVPPNPLFWSVFVAKGDTGSQGPKGDTGATGAAGTNGTNGADGKTLLNGTVDPAAGVGSDGDFYINNTSNKIFGPKAAGAWPTGVTLVGPQGPAGEGYTPPRARVLASGQVKSYAVGDDGDWMPGASLPAASRFYDNSDGTVKDNLTGLVWLKNANCSATLGGVVNSGTGLVWSSALTWSNNLASNSCGLTDGSVAGQWRLPNRTELMSLVDYSKFGPALPAGHPFTAIQAGNYWSGSTYALNAGSAWVVNVGGGYVLNGTKNYSGYFVWPVRSGQ